MIIAMALNTFLQMALQNMTLKNKKRCTYSFMMKIVFEGNKNLKDLKKKTLKKENTHKYIRH